MASNANQNQPPLEFPSPSHIGQAPQHHEDVFSPEDIHHLLGDVLGGDDSEDGGGCGGGAPSETGSSVHASIARTERKRSREKQRRSDVNKQFQDLTQLLRRMETEDPDEFSHLPPYSPANRVELMGRTVQMITVLYERNKKRKAEVTDLQEQLEASRKAGEETAAKLKESMMTPQPMGGNKVMMMVPMLMNTGGDPSQQQPAAMPFQPWMTSFMGMPAAPPAPSAEFTPSAAPHAMNMPFFMPMAMPGPMAPTAPTGDLKQEAKVGSNLAHCA